MPANDTWRERLSELSSAQRETIGGGSLSQRFTNLPIWASHPAYIGAFYGMLVAIALILPVGYKTEFVFTTWWLTWLFQSLLLIAATSLLGMCSRILIAIFKRPPVAAPRKVLFFMPFFGLSWLTMEITGLIDINPGIGWFFVILPGPLYVHLSWAPRWRMLCMLEDGLDPFEGKITIPDEIQDVSNGDDELMDVIETFEEE